MPRSGPIAEFRNPTGAAGAGAVAAEHLRGGPSVELHEVALGAAPVEPGVAEVVPEPVRVHVDAALAAAPDDALVDPAGCHGPPVAGPEPQLRPVCLGVPGADADVPVQAAGCVEADLDGPGLAALALDGDLPVPQVHVAAPRVVSVVPDSGQLRQADPGRPEHGDQGGVAALGERAARAGALQPGFAGREFEDLVTSGFGLHLVRPDRKDEAPRHGSIGWIRNGSSRSTTPSRASSTWSGTAAGPPRACTPGSPSACWPWPCASGTTGLPIHPSSGR